jgi:hypothetical protein
MASNRWSYTLIVDADLEPAALKRKLVFRHAQIDGSSEEVYP